MGETFDPITDVPTPADEVASDLLLGPNPSRSAVVAMTEGYTVETLVEMSEKKLIGLLDGLQNTKGLGLLDYSRIVKAVWCEKKHLYDGWKRNKVISRMERLPQTGMSEELWSRLPEHLLDRILACLPLPALLCMRPVCKRWSSLLSTQSFLDVYTEVPRESSQLLAIFERGEHGVVTNGCFTFCSVSERWYNIALSSPPFKESDQLAAGGGLICYVPQNDGENEDFLVVCNPLTKAWRAISLSGRIQMQSLLAMAVDKTTHAYKVIVTALLKKVNGPRLDAFDLTTQVYDSLTKTWKVTGVLPPGLLFPLHSVWCNGFLYGWCSKADQIWIYDIDRGLWRGEKIKMPDYALNSCNMHVVECRARLFLVIETGYTGHSPQIWELEPSSMECTEVARMPPEVFEEFLEKVGEFQCVGYNDTVCFIADDIPDVLFYHLGKELWLWMSRCPQFLDWHPYGYVGVALELRPDVSV